MLFAEAHAPVASVAILKAPDVLLYQSFPTWFSVGVGSDVKNSTDYPCIPL